MVRISDAPPQLYMYGSGNTGQTLPMITHIAITTDNRSQQKTSYILGPEKQRMRPVIQAVMCSTAKHAATALLRWVVLAWKCVHLILFRTDHRPCLVFTVITDDVVTNG